MKEMIPIKGIRKRVGIRIKWWNQLDSYLNLNYVSSYFYTLVSNTDEKNKIKGQISFKSDTLL